MNHRCAISGLAIFSAIALQGSPAAGQTRNQDLQIYAGEMFGDRLTEAPLTGSDPILDDDATFGARYTYYFTKRWGLQLSAGYASSRATQVATGDGNLGLTALGLDVLWNITPGFSFDSHPLMPYTEVGVGYAWADFDHPLYGAIGGTRVTLQNGNGYTANLGVGAKYYLSDLLFIDFDLRYRYLSRLINHYGQGMNTGETTLSLGYQF